MDAKYFREVTAPILSNTFNTVSIIASALVLIMAVTLVIFKASLMNRVTLRLQIGVSFFDLLTHIFSLFHHLKETTPAFCTFIGFYRSFGNMVYCFLNIAIALNLQLVFLHSLQPKRLWEICYWVAVLGLSLLANIPLLALDYFGKNNDNLCFLNKDKEASVLIQAININGVMVFTCLYCLCVSVFVVLKLLKNVDALKQMKTTTSLTNATFRPKLVNHLKKLIFRISLYPVVCCICLSGFIARFFVASAGGDNKTVGWILWSLLGLTTTGLLNCIAFLLDPTFHNATIDFIKDIKHKRRVRAHLSTYPLKPFNLPNNNQYSDAELTDATNVSDEEKLGCETSVATPSIYEGMNQEDTKALDNFQKFL